MQWEKSVGTEVKKPVTRVLDCFQTGDRFVRKMENRAAFLNEDRID